MSFSATFKDHVLSDATLSVAERGVAKAANDESSINTSEAKAKVVEHMQSLGLSFVKIF